MGIADTFDPHLSFDLVEDVRLLLEFPFMRNALMAGTIVAVLAGILGWLVVLRGESFSAHTLSVVGFPGAAGAVLVGVAPLFGLVAFCMLAALGIAGLSRSATGERQADSAVIGSVQAVAQALGFLFIGLYGGLLDGVTQRLFGTLVGVTEGDVAALLLTAALALGVLFAVGRPLLFASVDAEAAAARGVRVGGLSTLFLLLLGLAVAAVSQITGSLLVFALLVTPAATAQLVTARPARGIALSVAIALAVTWVGMAVAYFTVYPMGFFVTTLAFGGYVAVRAGCRVLAISRRRWSTA
ncbi:MAG: zinc/manganese transport system permease protein [Chloroflexota bacterium]|nr:zinc/manganese transport system permease protein [Chloroflexota bacterium]